jgi:hypothetical protein
MGGEVSAVDLLNELIFMLCIAFVLTNAYNINVRKYAFERSDCYGSKISKFICAH